MCLQYSFFLVSASAVHCSFGPYLKVMYGFVRCCCYCCWLYCLCMSLCVCIWWEIFRSLVGFFFSLLFCLLLCHIAFPRRTFGWLKAMRRTWIFFTFFCFFCVCRRSAQNRIERMRNEYEFSVISILVLHSRAMPFIRFHYFLLKNLQNITSNWMSERGMWQKGDNLKICADRCSQKRIETEK